jgi:hypothetical protein
MRASILAVLVALSSFVTAVAAAQSGETPEPVVVTGQVPVAYPGATPGGSYVPSLPAGKGKPAITWTGFAPQADGSSRVFVQLTHAVEHDLSANGKTVTLKLKKTRVHLRNNRLPIDTRFFSSPVDRVSVKRKGKDSMVVCDMRVDSTPAVREETDAHGYSYVVLEFPAGSYGMPVAAAPKAAPAEGGEETAATGDDEDAPKQKAVFKKSVKVNTDTSDLDMQALDNEKPPTQ